MPAQNTFSFWIEIEHVYLTPTDKIWATWSSFFGRPKLRFAHMTEKISIMTMMVAMVILMIMMTKKLCDMYESSWVNCVG